MFGRPSILFLHVSDGVCFVSGRGGGRVWRIQQRKSRERGQEFESRRNVKLMSLAWCIILWSKKMGPSVNSLRWFIYILFCYLGQVNSSLLWAAFLFLSFFFLPPPSPTPPTFSKDSDASGFAPTLSINQFKVINVVYSAEPVCIPLV